LTGIVEGDETFILESFKGKRSGLPRKSRERGGKSAKRGAARRSLLSRGVLGLPRTFCRSRANQPNRHRIIT
jgi:hypothetical protein